MKTTLLCSLLIITTFICCKESQKGMTFKEAENMGISFDSLELEYKTLHSLGKSDTLLIEKAGKAYYNFFNAFNTYLTNKNLKWPFEVKCFHKMYFSPDGSFNYFLFNFLNEPPYKVSPEQETKFKILLNEFIDNYKFPITTDVKYSQCGSIIYGSKKKN
jgi:hypothetical protein